jgi:uncharacterized protein YndB with AHSA1/START domain
VLDGLCSLRLTRRYEARPSEVWAVLIDPGSWLAPSQPIELRPGERFELKLRGGKCVRARVREVEPERILEFDWRFDREEPSVVRFELSEDGTGTLLVLEHRQLAEPLGMAYIARWEGSLHRLSEDVTP